MYIATSDWPSLGVLQPLVCMIIISSLNMKFILKKTSNKRSKFKNGYPNIADLSNNLRTAWPLRMHDYSAIDWIMNNFWAGTFWVWISCLKFSLLDI